MTILRVKVKRVEVSGLVSYTYPKEYDSNKIQVVCYESGGGAQSINLRGGGDEYCIGVVKKADALAFLKSPDIIELTKTEANIEASTWIPQQTIIEDDTKIIAILQKVNSSQTLSQAEKNAINPDNIETGVTRTKSLTDMLTDLGV